MGFSAAFRRTDIVIQAEHVLSRDIPSEPTPEEEACVFPVEFLNMQIINIFRNSGPDLSPKNFYK